MKVLLINGSPKPENGGSASGIILDALKQRFGGAAVTVTQYNAAKQNAQEFLRAVSGCNALVFAFPLYVDGIPSHLLRLLCEIQPHIAQEAPGARVYAVVNNGFFQGQQNALALEMMRNFCVRADCIWGGGLGVGGGGMAGAAPVGRGPLKKLGLALDALTEAIKNGKTIDDRLFAPGFPRFLYQLLAHISWRTQARKNGLKPAQMYDRR